MFDPDGAKPEDISASAYRITQVNARYIWGGRTLNPQRIAEEGDFYEDDWFWKFYSKMLKLKGTTSYYSGSRGLGLDCSGYFIMVNNQNPDRSMTFDPLRDNAASIAKKIESWTDIRYDKITDPDDLKEGDILIRNDKKHIAFLVKDPASGELVVSEAPTHGQRVGNQQLGSIEEIKTKMDPEFKNYSKDGYTVYRDKGNYKEDPYFTTMPIDNTRVNSWH